MRAAGLAVALAACASGPSGPTDKAVVMRLAWDDIVRPGAVAMVPLNSGPESVTPDSWRVTIHRLGGERHLVVLRVDLGHEIRAAAADARAFALVDEDGSVTLLEPEGFAYDQDVYDLGLGSPRVVEVGGRIVVGECSEAMSYASNTSSFFEVDPAAGTLRPLSGWCSEGVFGPTSDGVVALSRYNGTQTPIVVDRYRFGASGDLESVSQEPAPTDVWTPLVPMLVAEPSPGQLEWVSQSADADHMVWRREDLALRHEVGRDELALSMVANTSLVMRRDGSGAVDGIGADGRLVRWHVEDDGRIEDLAPSPAPDHAVWGSLTGFGAALSLDPTGPSRAPPPHQAREVRDDAFVAVDVRATPCVDDEECYWFGEHHLLAAAALDRASFGVYLVHPWEQVSDANSDEFVGVYIAPVGPE